MTNATAIFIPGLLCTEWVFHSQVDGVPGKAVFADICQHDTINAIAQSALSQVDGAVVPIGLSMGGYIALEMARLAPTRISAMALFSTNCRQDDMAQRAYREQTIKLASQGGFQGMTRHFLSKCLSPVALANTAIVDGVLTMAADVGSDVFVKQQKAILGRRDQHDTLAAFSAPLLIICGSDDKLTPPHLSQEMAALAQHADMRLLPDVGHLSTLEAPMLCRMALGDLIASL